MSAKDAEREARRQIHIKRIEASIAELLAERSGLPQEEWEEYNAGTLQYYEVLLRQLNWYKSRT